MSEAELSDIPTPPPRTDQRGSEPSPRRSNSRSRSRSRSRDPDNHRRNRRRRSRSRSRSRRHRRSRSRSRSGSGHRSQSPKKKDDDRFKKLEERCKRLEDELKEAKRPVKSYSPRLIKKVADDEYIDLKELREDTLNRDNQEAVLATTGTVDIISREKEHLPNKGEAVTTKDEYMLLSASLADLYRHVSSADKRFRCYVKYNKTICSLLYGNKYTIKSVLSYDRAFRQLKAKSFSWEFDNEIAATNLVHYFPGLTKAEKHGGSKGPKKLSLKRKGGGVPQEKTDVCYPYLEGGCGRTQRACRFVHGCTACGTGPDDTHVLKNCRKAHLVQQRKNGVARVG